MPPTHLLATPRPGPRVLAAPAWSEPATAPGRRPPLDHRRDAAAGRRGPLGYLKTWPPLATVMSASMAPTINTGDIVVLKRLDAPAAINQVVMVRVPDEAAPASATRRW